jgi:hypothetical protein
MMYKTLKLLIALVMVGLTGCTQLPSYSESVNSWVGSRETALVASWGIPSQVYTTDGVKYITYNRSRTIYIPGEGPSYQTTTTYYGAITRPIGGRSGYTINRYCDTTFMIVDGVIKSASFRGNDCR